MTYHIITILPDVFESYLYKSIMGRAVENKLIKIKLYNPRDFVKGSKRGAFAYKAVDGRPYGGGPGMVMEAEPILKAYEKILKSIKDQKKKKVIIFGVEGEKFTNKKAINCSKKYTDIILICGRYDGVDARVMKILKAEEVSIGDYVLTGGELPAMILVDSISRQIEGVLGKNESLEENRNATSEIYTRPEIITYAGKKYRVPKVLLSGDHKKIEEWKTESKNKKKL